MDDKEKQVVIKVYDMHENKITNISIMNDYSLYHIVVFLDKYLKNPHDLDNFSLEKMRGVREAFLGALKNFRAINFPNTQYVKIYQLVLEWITEVLLRISKNPSFKYTTDLCEFLCDVGKACKKKLDKKNLSKTVVITDTYISECMSALIEFYLKDNDLQSAETWAIRHLEWLNNIKKNDRLDIAKRVFATKLNLANIYFEWGYPEQVLSLIKEADVIFKTSYYNEFDIFLIGMSEFCRKAVRFYFESKKFDLGMKIANAFLSMIQDTKIDMLSSKEDPEKIKSWINNKKYLSFAYELSAKAKEEMLKKSFHAFQELMDVLKFDFDNKKGTIKITVYHRDDFHFLRKKLKAFGINPMTDGYSLEFYSFDFSQEQSIDLFNKFSLFLTKKKESEKLFTANVSQGLFPPPVIYPVTTMPSPMTTASAFDTAASSAQESALDNEAESEQQDEQPSSSSSFSAQPVNDKRKSYIQNRKIIFPNTHLTYQSTENNTGAVKSLNGDCMPGEVWFGYIPDWIYQDINYNPEFLARLVRGKLGKNHIRDITKELKTNDGAALKYENRYKYKIVIPGTKFRLYGWIEEEMIDADGKKRYLVCFGHLEDYHNKVLKLPDPKTIKAHELKQDNQKKNSF